MEKIAVLGAGVMGVDIAATFSHFGYDVILFDIEKNVLLNTPKKIRRNIRNYSMMSPTTMKDWVAEDVLSHIELSNDLKQLEGVSWVIENITEDWQAKKELFSAISDISKRAFIAVNTSCLSITRLASLVANPEKVVGIHFLNPVPLKDVAEAIYGFYTSDETVAAAKMLLQRIKITPVFVRDSPGFVVNRMSHIFMNEAAFIVQEKIAEPKQIDLLFKKGYGHKMGPLETADLIGLDTVVRSLKVLFDDYGDPKFRCCPLLQHMVDAGLLGVKSGRGFYSY